ncbi:hypothetical protein [Paracidovorax citrulli]|uniref:hypothetical protein n=1 Tax=Paracidovorax citrulli TaxID=80869 RepID=UPI0009E24C8A|nr:hypothetical protein [Paracidovorax citrulli]
MEKKTTGSWLVHHTNKIQKVSSAPGFNKILVAGKAGILLSALAADKQIDLSNERVEALAEAAQINALECDSLLKKLEERKLIDRANSGISVLGVSSTTVLERTAEIFEASNPSKIEFAALALSEKSSINPISTSDARRDIAEQFEISFSEVDNLFQRAESIGFVDAEHLKNNERLYFNGNLFRRNNPVKVKLVLDSLSPGEQRSLKDLTDALYTRACIEFEEAKRILGEKLCEKVMAVGIFDLNIVSNTSGDTGFVTLPAAFNKFSDSIAGDAFDLAKALVSSITYGMVVSNYSRGKITMVRDLLKTLVNGNPVGPSPAISQDYRALELKGVVHVYQGTKSGYFGTRTGWLMTLLKREVGELALQVIQKGDVSDQSLTALPSATITKYLGPEENRAINRKRQVDSDPAATNSILNILRFGKENG